MYAKDSRFLIKPDSNEGVEVSDPNNARFLFPSFFFFLSLTENPR